VRDCTHEKVYDKVGSSKAHLKTKHPELSAEDIAGLLPPKKRHKADRANIDRPVELHSVSYTPQRCSHPDCTSKNIWQFVGPYLEHLGASHGIFDHADQDPLVLSTTDSEHQ
jgi:hypothetical protein